MQARRGREDCAADLSKVLQAKGQAGRIHQGGVKEGAIPGLPGREETGIKKDDYHWMQREWKIHSCEEAWQDYGSSGYLSGRFVLGCRMEAQALCGV